VGGEEGGEVIFFFVWIIIDSNCERGDGEPTEPLSDIQDHFKRTGLRRQNTNCHLEFGFDMYTRKFGMF
jgi:hypothetical protein